MTAKTMAKILTNFLLKENKTFTFFSGIRDPCGIKFINMVHKH